MGAFPRGFSVGLSRELSDAGSADAPLYRLERGASGLPPKGSRGLGSAWLGFFAFSWLGLAYWLCLAYIGLAYVGLFYNDFQVILSNWLNWLALLGSIKLDWLY